MKLKKRPFHFSNTGSQYSMYYRPFNLRHQIICWLIERYGYSDDMPDGDWIVTLSWQHDNFVPGLLFREA